MKFSLIMILAVILNVSLVLSSDCFRTGCSGEVCSDLDLASICIYRPQFECYRAATCERQANGRCGWTQTEELQRCLENAQNGPTVAEDINGYE